MTQSKHLPTIAGLFTAALIISNVLECKIAAFWGATIDVGTILFPLSYVFGDILTEVYGYAASRRVVWTGFAALVAMAVFFEIARLLPPAPFWDQQAAFEALFAQTPRIVAASILAYFFGEFSNSYILAKMKIGDNGRRMGWRFVASTLVGEGVDTSLFCLIAFAGTMPQAALIEMTLSVWIGKVLWEIAALPLSLAFARWLKRAEGIDVYDRTTNFNPFALNG